MATYTERQSGFSLRAMLLLCLFAFVFGGVLAALRTPNGAVKTGSHATDRHAEATAIRQQLARCGPDEEWVLKKDDTIQCWLCELPDGRWGVMFSQLWNSLVDGCRWRELTSFCPADGSYRKVICYLEKIATRIK